MYSELHCVELGWIELGWIELHWVGLQCIGLERHLMEMVTLNKGRRERRFLSPPEIVGKQDRKKLVISRPKKLSQLLTIFSSKGQPLGAALDWKTHQPHQTHVKALHLGPGELIPGKLKST